MAVTITRTAWTDDDGSGTTGTVLNAAVKTSLYDQIDAALALVMGTRASDLLFTDATYDIGKSSATRPRDGFFSRNLEVGGLLTVSGFGTHAIRAGGAGVHALKIVNSTNGTGSIAALSLGNATDDDAFQIRGYAAGFTTSGFQIASGVALIAGYAGGISLVASNAAGAINFHTGGAGRTMLLAPTGVLTITNLTSGNLTSASGVITSSSDERLKDILGPLDYGLAEVLALKPIRARWNMLAHRLQGLPTDLEFGSFGAAQVEAFMPLAVSTGHDGYKGLSDRVILGATVNAIKALHARIEHLERKAA